MGKEEDDVVKHIYAKDKSIQITNMPERVSSTSIFDKHHKSTVRIHHNIDGSDNQSVSLPKKEPVDNSQSVKTLKIQESYPDSTFHYAKALNNQPFSFKDQSIQKHSDYESNSVGIGQG